VSVVRDLGHHTDSHTDSSPLPVSTRAEGARGATVPLLASVRAPPKKTAAAAEGKAAGKGKAAVEGEEKATSVAGDQLDEEADEEEARQEAMAARERAIEVRARMRERERERSDDARSWACRHTR
jgi:hypothetical protein